ncbi:DUF5317 domain-containing protein [Alkalibacter mobilis]|uniref:DUF5317 domain-containing protein n=1 Tax=Alkalibacter mobilis TaxID=2787712 RepID=UPI00189E52A2|nr:DUF5317 domain-containing protein [Alkalibacter mobilis]MBF7096592.1 DUF5317 family protein [Alkalibacter mobilis]
MIIVLLLLAIIIGYVRKGRISNLANLKIRLTPLMVLAFLIQAGIYAGYTYEVAFVMDYDILLHFISYIMLFAALMSNFENKWFILLTTGMILNFLVIFLNGGKMPVSVDAAEAIGLGSSLDLMFLKRAGTHQPLTDGMLLSFLADVIPFSYPGIMSYFNNIYSIGDFVIYLGAMGVVQSAMLMKEPHGYSDELEEDDLEPMPNPEDFFFDNIDEDDEKNLAELRKKREETLEQETRKIYLDLKDEESPFETASESDIELQSDFTNQTESNPLNVGNKESATEETVSQQTERSDENEYEFEIEDKDYNISGILGTSQLENQIIAGEKYELDDSKENIETSTSQGETVKSDIEKEKSNRKYYTRPLHERMIIDLEPRGIEEFTTSEEAEEIETDMEPSTIEYDTKDEETTIIDTQHQFIIVDGRIIENPNYYKRVQKPATMEAIEKPLTDELLTAEEDIETEMDSSNEDSFEMFEEDSVIETEELSGIDESEPEKESGNILLRLTDDDRIELMKKMKERKEKGYSLVQVKVGDKTISFWKKDL